MLILMRNWKRNLILQIRC